MFARRMTYIYDGFTQKLFVFNLLMSSTTLVKKEETIRLPFLNFFMSPYMVALIPGKY